MTGDGPPDPVQVHVRLWKPLENGVNVSIVNGRLVRSVFDIDFTAAATTTSTSSSRGEVWIDIYVDGTGARRRPGA